MSTPIKYKDEVFTTGNNVSFEKEDVLQEDGTTKYVVNVFISDVKVYILDYPTEFDRNHVMEVIQRCVNGYIDLDNIDNSREPGTGSSSSGVFVGYVDHTKNMPTTRLDGSPLEDEDYARPLSTETFPFTTLDGKCTFQNRFSKAYYSKSTDTWIVDVGAIQDTSETPVKDKTKESIFKDKSFQNEVNKEIVDYVKQYEYTFNTASNLWHVEHNLDKFPRVTTFDETNSVIIGNVTYINKNTLEVNFVKPQKGKLYIN